MNRILLLLFFLLLSNLFAQEGVDELVGLEKLIDGLVDVPPPPDAESRLRKLKEIEDGEEILWQIVVNTVQNHGSWRRLQDAFYALEHGDLVTNRSVAESRKILESEGLQIESLPAFLPKVAGGWDQPDHESTPEEKLIATKISNRKVLIVQTLQVLGRHGSNGDAMLVKPFENSKDDQIREVASATLAAIAGRNVLAADKSEANSVNKGVQLKKDDDVEAHGVNNGTEYDGSGSSLLRIAWFLGIAVVALLALLFFRKRG